MRLNPKKYEYKLPGDVVAVHRVILRKGKYYFVMYMMPFLERPGKKDIATPVKCCFQDGCLVFDVYPEKSWHVEVMVDKRGFL